MKLASCPAETAPCIEVANVKNTTAVIRNTKYK